jgi:hypothetical protein
MYRDAMSECQGNIAPMVSSLFLKSGLFQRLRIGYPSVLDKLTMKLWLKQLSDLVQFGPGFESFQK